MKAVKLTLFLFAFAPAALPVPARAQTGCATGYESLVYSRADLFNEVIQANTLFPQTSVGIVMSAVAKFLERPTSLQNLARAPSPGEVETAALAMNRVHEAFRIPVATEGYPRDMPVKRIPVQAVAKVLDDGSLDTVEAVYKIALVLHQFDKTVATGRTPVAVLARSQEKSAKLDAINEFYQSRKDSSDGKILARLGGFLGDFLKSQEVKELGKSYRRKLTEVAVAQDRESRELLRNQAVYGFVSSLHELLYQRLKSSFSDLGEQEIDGIILALWGK